MIGVLSIIAVTAVLIVLFIYQKRKLRNNVSPKNWNKDVVYLYLFPRSATKQVVNICPYAVKLETWIRMNRIKYEVTETLVLSPNRRQIPYVWFNGIWLEESGYIIEYLSDYFKITEQLTEEQQGISRAIQLMVELNTALTVVWYRYVHKPKEFSRVFRLAGVSLWRKISVFVIKIGTSLKAHFGGMGRDSPERIATIAGADIKALSNILGEKQYLMGATMTNVDCSVFGLLCQVVFVDMSYPHKALLQGECNNLQSYIYRIKDTLWPDWELLCDMKNKFE